MFKIKLETQNIKPRHHEITNKTLQRMKLKITRKQRTMNIEQQIFRTSNNVDGRNLDKNLTKMKENYKI